MDEYTRFCGSTDTTTLYLTPDGRYLLDHPVHSSSMFMTGVKYVIVPTPSEKIPCSTTLYPSHKPKIHFFMNKIDDLLLLYKIQDIIKRTTNKGTSWCC